ncbi:MAG: hypothetical protein H2054_00860 [Sphingomonas sp.]|uniref:hypothetical protein n=1 Tax=Sphingomonas sp. TaxID=28214 RepID=UPI00181D4DCC|nr:hypothetical protein [Sphingomonas sp.]
MSVLVKVDRFLRATGMAPTRFGVLTLNDPALVRDLRRGRLPRPDTVARIDQFIAEHR